MQEWMAWTATGIMTAITGVTAWLLKTIANLPADYVPRSQINNRFDQIKAEIHADMEKQDDRTEKRFDRLEAYLVRIESKLDGKADK